MENKKIAFEYVPMDFTIKKMPDVAGVAVDSQDNIYYTIRSYGGYDAPVIVVDNDGKYLRAFGHGMLKNPHGIATDTENNVYVCDAMRNCIFKFSNTGDLLMTIGTPDSPCDNGCVNYDFRTIAFSNDSLNHPSKLVVTKAGDIFIADGYGNARVHHYSKDGKHIKSWGDPGDQPGQFNVVHGIGYDEETGFVYVCDRENERVQIFDSEGNLQAIWNDIWRPCDVVVRGDYAYVAELGELFFVDNVLYEPGSRRHHSQLRVFDKKTGEEVFCIGTADSGEKGSFFTLHCVTMNNKGELLAGEVSYPRDEIWIAYPNGVGMSHKTHPFLQKFRPVAAE